MKYVYPAVFRKDKELADTWSIEFPDVAGAATCGYSLYEALEMAEDALAGMLCDWEDFKAGNLTDMNGKKITVLNNRIVDPTPIKEVVAEPDEYSTSAFVTLIKADTDAYRKMLAEQAKNKEAGTKSA
ncbi:MAG: type II toxin-antitoxin system HicB family antitoxin [Selenomonadaceae bacterium]|nr:type II toxin-antitoxin system HicB family antitoxin [Selenomonadaceae bacterium]